MAIKLPEFLKGLTNTGAKSRVFLVFAAIGVIGFIIFIATRYFQGANQAAGPSKVAGAPTGLQTVPGGKMSSEFYRAVTQANVQAAEQAKITGASAVPTLINVPGEQPQAQACCCDENQDIATCINNTVKAGKLSPDDASKLSTLAKNKVTVAEFSSNLNELVKQTKIPPEQARQLYECYNRQYQRDLLAEQSQLIDKFIKTGELPLSAANKLLALLKSGVSPTDYAAELARMTKENEIAAATAAQLLDAYNQQRLREQAKEGSYQLQQMGKSGQLSPDAASSLDALQKRNASLDEYSAELNRLVAAGKMTPETAAKLLKQYQDKLGQSGAASAANDMVAAELAATDGDIDDMLKSGRISADVAKQLKDAMRNGHCMETITQLVKDKKLQPDDAKKLLTHCQKINSLKSLADKLAGLSEAECIATVNDALKAGTLKTEEANTLLAQCRAGIAKAPIPGVGGGEAFSKLQERLQAAQPQEQPTAAAVAPVGPTGPTPEELQAAAQAAQAAEQQRQDRLQQIMTNMSNQAQQLITAWQPTPMQHQAGRAPIEASATPEGQTATSPTSPLGPLGANTPQGPALIKAGTILFAVLDTTVNSDYPDTPAMATVVQGKFKGAKLLGKLTVFQGVPGTPGMDKVSLTFNLMDNNGWPNSLPVNAFAIDPDTARTVLASTVDYHYLARYGGLFASSFLQGYSQAITQSGSTTTTGFSTSTTTPALSPSNKIAVGLGQVGTSLSSTFANYVNIPPTVVVNSGVGLGILFMADVTENPTAAPGATNGTANTQATTSTTSTTTTSTTAPTAGIPSAPGLPTQGTTSVPTGSVPTSNVTTAAPTNTTAVNPVSGGVQTTG